MDEQSKRLLREAGAILSELGESVSAGNKGVSEIHATLTQLLASVQQLPQQIKPESMAGIVEAIRRIRIEAPVTVPKFDVPAPQVTVIDKTRTVVAPAPAAADRKPVPYDIEVDYDQANPLRIKRFRVIPKGE